MPKTTTQEQAIRTGAKMSREEIKIRTNLKNNFPFYAKKCLKIRLKKATVIDGLKVKVAPFILNKAQQYINGRLDAQKLSTGNVRALILKGRQQGCCHHPDMRVLTADYNWVRIGDVTPGIRLIATDEENSGFNINGRKMERRFRIATVEATRIVHKPAYKITLSNGTTLVATGEHRYLAKRRNGCETEWRTVDDTRVGDHLRAATCAPDDRPLDFEDGWFSGILDGEGTFAASPQVRIGVTQVDGPVLSRMRSYLDRNNFHYYEQIDDRTDRLGNKPVHHLRIDRMTDVLRLMTLTRPSRFMHRELFTGKKFPKTCEGFVAWPEVVSIKPVGVIDAVDLQTSEKTFICEGIVSHNSTLVTGRYYHITTHNEGIKTFILTHRDDATANLFKMVQRFHEHNNPLVKPHTSYSNRRELVFDKLDSAYGLGTAGSSEVGRSDTIDLLHLSECASFVNAQDIVSGVLQAAEAAEEIILESTAKGVGNIFYDMWRDAEAGLSDFQAIFVPWYWQAEYTRTVPEGTEWDAEEETYYQQNKDNGFTREHLFWRRYKMREMRDPKLFKQEYPANAAEAFQTTGADTFIQPEPVLAARKCTVGCNRGAIIMGLDPARGGDRTAVCIRQGSEVKYTKTWSTPDTTVILGVVRELFEDGKHGFIDRLFIDIGGLGGPLYDSLSKMPFAIRVTPVNFGSRKVFNPRRYYNKRAEMWGNLRDWLEDDTIPSNIPDSDSLQADLCAPGYSYDNEQRYLLESKEKMKARGVISPDEGDALALTFAEPVLSRQDLEVVYDTSANFVPFCL